MRPLDGLFPVIQTIARRANVGGCASPDGQSKDLELHIMLTGSTRTPLKQERPLAQHATAEKVEQGIMKRRNDAIQMIEMGRQTTETTSSLWVRRRGDLCGSLAWVPWYGVASSAANVTLSSST